MQAGIHASGLFFAEGMFWGRILRGPTTPGFSGSPWEGQWALSVLCTWALPLGGGSIWQKSSCWWAFPGLSAWLGAPLLGWIPAWPLRLKLNVLIFPQTGIRCWKWHSAGTMFSRKFQISASSHPDMLQPIWAGATPCILRLRTVRAAIFSFSHWLHWAPPPPNRVLWEAAVQRTETHWCCLSLMGLPERRGSPANQV